MWSEEQRQLARERSLKRWADPAYREKVISASKKPPLCPQCGDVNIEHFYVSKLGKRTNAYCKPCHKIRTNENWHSKTILEKQASRVKAMYGITPEEYIMMYEKQEGKCAICGQLPTTLRGLHTDHNHITNKVRGLLCHGCNTGIGALKEDTEILSNAIKYLRS